MGSKVNMMTATNYAGHSSRKIYGKIGCKSCSHTAVALHNGGNLATGEVQNTSNQWAGHLPVVDTGCQCKTSFQMTTGLPTSKDANVMTPSDCIEGSCGIGSWNMIPINAIVGAIYIMYSRQLPWGILISYCKWNEMNFISFTVNIFSFLISNAISFLHSVYFIFSKFYFIHSQHLFHSPWHSFHSLAACISFSHSIYFICSNFYFIHSWHLFHAPTASISFVLTFMSFSHDIFIILK